MTDGAVRGGEGELRPVALVEDAGGIRLRLLDQRALPGEERYVDCRTAAEVARAVGDMVVRGAPALGVTGAYGVFLAAREAAAADAAAPPAPAGAADPGAAAGEAAWLARVRAAGARLAGVRPTAVNLSWAVARMLGRAEALAEAGVPPALAAEALREEAAAIHAEDAAMNRRLAELGAELLPPRCTVLTYCNTGSLAAAGPGTALGIIRAARGAGKEVRVFVCETRPFLQGARLTAWELRRDGFPVTLITDNMAGHFLQRGEIDAVVVGADRVCRNGDVANKIGTYTLAVLARENGVPFYVAAPWSSVDPGLPRGDGVIIEERPPDEVLGWDGVRWAPPGVAVRNPAFDVTPARYVTALVTDRGVARPPLEASLGRLAAGTAAGTAAADARRTAGSGAGEATRRA